MELRLRGNMNPEPRTQNSDKTSGFWVLVSGFLLLASCATAARTPPAVSLGQFIDQAIVAPPFEHAIWGILIEESDGRVLYQRNADLLLIPASNRKLFVSAFAAQCLGVSTTIPTELWLNGFVLNETLHGDIVLKGHGDPSLGGRYEADRDVRLMPYLDAIRSRGITTVTGSIIGDVSRFDREIIPGSWENDDLGSYYAAPVDALTWNENVVGVQIDARDCSNVHVTTDPNFVEAQVSLLCVPRPEGSEEVVPRMRTDDRNTVQIIGFIDLKTASTLYGDLVAVERPGLYAAQALDDFLRRNGVEIRGEPTENADGRPWLDRLVSTDSPHLSLLLGTFLKVSDNLFGETFFKGSSGQVPASYEAAREREGLFLENEVGLSPTEYYFEDGSGLSTHNRVTSRAILKMLRYMTRPEHYGTFFQLLATPGEEGTLRRRLAGLETTMRGKTGTVNGVNALSGYVIGRDGNLRYFSIIANHHIGSSSDAVKIIDSIVRRITDF
jgi:D-alanyl-D-alanine carboxypeptidase/D-alanyl-D-alanine-endopeptidase (penicillin-binding protein 4)